MLVLYSFSSFISPKISRSVVSKNHSSPDITAVVWSNYRVIKCTRGADTTCHGAIERRRGFSYRQRRLQHARKQGGKSVRDRAVGIALMCCVGRDAADVGQTSHTDTLHAVLVKTSCC